MGKLGPDRAMQLGDDEFYDRLTRRKIHPDVRHEQRTSRSVRNV